jgi:L-ribulose-5-phosphate 3-epimerase UlaE
MLFPEHIEPLYDGQTIFHKYASEPDFLQILLKVAKKNDRLDTLLSVVYPDVNTGMSAFDLAVKSKSPRSIETMLEMLVQLPDLRVGRYIRKHYSDLFGSGLVAFENYINSCMFRHKRMLTTQYVRWTV